MKSAEALKAALNKYKTEMSNVQERLSWTMSWLDAANFMQEPELFVAQVKERDELRNREKEMDFKIRFTQWVLENDEPKETKNVTTDKNF